MDKRIDVIATAIMAGMNVDDLTDLQLAYAPQYGSAKDAINMAGYVASNILHQDAPTAYWDEIIESGEETCLLDVRSKPEYDAGSLADAFNIPIDELRERLGELPRGLTITPFCTVGLRSYIATRILKQRGFKVKNLSGGYRTYEISYPEDKQDKQA